MYQHCQVLGIATNKAPEPEIYIFESVERLAKISIPGYISIEVSFDGEIFQYTDKQARDCYGLDLRRIHFDDDPVEEDLLLATQINNATNEKELNESLKLI